jgi:2-keto-4-pentenoate hydratase/2-oxohepta-3-ene-1,7-dioic acid hydratase in catechol pathway
MKLITFTEGSTTRLGSVHDGRVSPLDFQGGMLEWIRSGRQAAASAPALSKQQFSLSAVKLVKLEPPISDPEKIVAIGLNYVDHASEGKVQPPKTPLSFAKFSSSIIGPGSEIRWSPHLTSQVDFEAELVVVIGKPARNVSQANALDYVFGYTCGNDVSARDLQFSDGQWVRSKSLDTFAPLGPWIVTADEIPDPQSLAIQSSVNGTVMQDSNTRNMLFGIAYLVHYLSESFTLMPGDLIFSGTPAGVGAFRTPPIFLGDGDEVVIEVEKIGRLVNRCRTIPSV